VPCASASCSWEKDDARRLAGPGTRTIDAGVACSFPVPGLPHAFRLERMERAARPEKAATPRSSAAVAEHARPISRSVDHGGNWTRQVARRPAPTAELIDRYVSDIRARRRYTATCGGQHGRSRPWRHRRNARPEEARSSASPAASRRVG